MKSGTWEKSTIKEIKYRSDGYIDITLADIWSFSFIPEIEEQTYFKVGDLIETRSRNNMMVGVRINGMTLMDKTDEEHDAQITAREVKRKLDQIKDFQDNMADYDEEVSSMPEVFQRRINLFRKKGGLEWRIQWEGYELSSCREAIRIAQYFPQKRQMKRFFDDESTLVNGKKYEIGSNQHSGNTWGYAKRLAFWFVTNPENVYMEHGVGTILCGCDEYGCVHPRP